MDLQFSETVNLNNSDITLKKEDNSSIFRAMAFIQIAKFEKIHLILKKHLPPEIDIRGEQYSLSLNLS